MRNPLEEMKEAEENNQFEFIHQNDEESTEELNNLVEQKLNVNEEPNNNNNNKQDSNDDDLDLDDLDDVDASDVNLDEDLSDD